jgi:hypothetical protein
MSGNVRPQWREDEDRSDNCRRSEEEKDSLTFWHPLRPGTRHRREGKTAGVRGAKLLRAHRQNNTAD